MKALKTRKIIRISWIVLSFLVILSMLAFLVIPLL